MSICPFTLDFMFNDIQMNRDLNFTWYLLTIVSVCLLFICGFSDIYIHQSFIKLKWNENLIAFNEIKMLHLTIYLMFYGSCTLLLVMKFALLALIHNVFINILLPEFF